MSTHDSFGREWARVDQVKEGSILIPDGDFTSLVENQEYVVHADEHGLFLKGKYHSDGEIGTSVDFYLHGQLTGETDEDATHYIGLYLKRT